jgi:putative hydrolase of the HAD superfamily
VIRGVVFDLDDTLYPERDYVMSGFAAVAADVATTEEERVRLFAWLTAAFTAGVRGDTFDRLRTRFPEVAARASAYRMIESYRTHQPMLMLGDDARAVLGCLTAAGLRLGVITDGPTASQAAKAEALGLSRWCSPIILTETLGPGLGKPHPAAFEAIAAAWDLEPGELVHVADNPRKDFCAPRRLGWRTIRLRQPGQMYADAEPPDAVHAPDLEISGLAELPRRLGLRG